ncbi:MAG TPA: TIGR03862 family flavoprotein [Rhodocyclaceae bacterium]|nr:TIGR03862 family flavoprotein [Rhodocyclaceae bacterium]
MPPIELNAVAIVGGGPAGLMAAEVLSSAGQAVHVFDAMPSVGRKFLLAGRGGLNLTHSEAPELFLSRYGARREFVAPWLAEFGPQALRDWAAGLGVSTFVGSSGRVFPQEMKAAPLLRAWLHRLRQAGVVFHPRHRWCGWHEPPCALRFATPDGEVRVRARAVVLALGGGSWAALGSNGAWMELLREQQIPLQALRPANCGFDAAWSDYWRRHLAERYAGSPVKAVKARLRTQGGATLEKSGEFVVTRNGVEGGAIYALSAPLRDLIAAQGYADLQFDLQPGRSLEALQASLAEARGRDSMANHLRAHAGIHGVKLALLFESLPSAERQNTDKLAAGIKACRLRLIAPRPLDEAISSAGGVDFSALNDSLMLKTLPGVFCAGEMLDWEAPTGGYLLSACCAAGRIAGKGALHWLNRSL